MRHSLTRTIGGSRAGITLVEVILVIIGLLLLLSFFLPAFRQARGPARRVQCLNNLKNLVLATTNYASVHQGKLPLLTVPALGLASPLGRSTWVVTLMPYLDRADTHEYINQQVTPAAAMNAVKAVLEHSYPVLQCPDDVDHFKQPGGLSYGANIGYGPWRGVSNGITASYAFGAKDHCSRSIDWNRNGKLDPVDKEITYATGVFWMAEVDEGSPDLDDIINGDGTGQTILLAESLNISPMHQMGPAKDGINPAAVEAGIGIGIDALELARHSTPSLFLNKGTAPNDQYTRYFKPGRARDTAAGGWPRAGSAHYGLVNVVFADGHTSSIDNKINWAVWASLHTPGGTRHGEAKLNEADF